MTIPEVRQAIYDRFVTEWADTTEFTFEGEDTGLDSGTEPWVRLSVLWGPRAQDTLGAAGNRKFRTRGIAFVQVFTPTNKGMKQGETLAQAARTVFEGVSFSGIAFDNAQARNAGPDGKWEVTVVEASFAYDEIK